VAVGVFSTVEGTVAFFANADLNSIWSSQTKVFFLELKVVVVVVIPDMFVIGIV
jgi:hypothetical protein